MHHHAKRIKDSEYDTLSATALPFTMVGTRTTLAICLFGSAMAFSVALLSAKAQEPMEFPPEEEAGFKEIYIDLGVQMMFLLEHGVPIHMYPVSTGAQSTPTPVGEFEVHRKQELRISGLATPYRMQYYLSFTKSGSMGMHALPYLGDSPASSNYWFEALDHIGIPVSHGCVRLLPDDALTLYQWTDVGTPVHISSTTAFRSYLSQFPLPTFVSGTGTFLDIVASPYGTAIDYGQQYGIVEGYADNTFRPLQTVNRAEFTKILAETYASDEEIAQCLPEYGHAFSYPDASQSAWYGKYLCVAHRMMDIRGYPDGSFRPSQPINFAEAAKILANAAVLENEPDDARFLETTVWYRPYTQAMAGKDVIPPTINSYAQLVTRGEMMEMIYRLKTDMSSLPDATTLAEYSSMSDGFSFAYPAHIFVAAQETVEWPFGQGGKTFPGMKLIHEIPVEKCGASGLPEHCTPLTRDIAIGFFVIPQSFASIQRQAESWQTQESFSLQDHAGFSFVMGVEGEYAYYFFVPLTDGKTLMITRDALDESILSTYQQEENFFPTARQKQLFEQIMATISFGTLPHLDCENGSKFSVYFYSKTDMENAMFDLPVRVERCIVPKTQRIADAALRALFSGPTSDEEEKGALTSNDLQNLSPLYLGVSIENGSAVVNFKREALEILNSAAARQHMAKSPIRMTLLQFPTITDVKYAIEGEIFDEWDA